MFSISTTLPYQFLRITRQQWLTISVECQYEDISAASIICFFFFEQWRRHRIYGFVSDDVIKKRAMALET
jgi:hypothetical protein